jgi:hypothetical protein
MKVVLFSVYVYIYLDENPLPILCFRGVVPVKAEVLLPTPCKDNLGTTGANNLCYSILVLIY